MWSKSIVLLKFKYHSSYSQNIFVKNKCWFNYSTDNLLKPCLPGPSGRLTPDTDSGPADFSTSTNSVVLMYSVFVTVLIITYKNTIYTIQSNVFIAFSLPVKKVSNSRNSNITFHSSEFQFNKEVFCFSS